MEWRWHFLPKKLIAQWVYVSPTLCSGRKGFDGLLYCLKKKKPNPTYLIKANWKATSPSTLYRAITCFWHKSCQGGALGNCLQSSHTIDPYWLVIPTPVILKPFGLQSPLSSQTKSSEPQKANACTKWHSAKQMAATYGVLMEGISGSPKAGLHQGSSVG